MKEMMCVFLLSFTCSLAQTDLVTFTNRQGRVYEKVRLQKYDEENLLWRAEDGLGGGKIRLADLPEDLQKKFGVDATQLAQRQFEKAAAAGYFREVDRIVYDLRKPQPTWVLFANAKLIQILEGENSALVDPQPDAYASIEAVHVKNLTVLSDTERFAFRAMPVGSFSYTNKRGNERVVRSYDVGRTCSINEIPDELRSGELASAPLKGSTRLTKGPTETTVGTEIGLPGRETPSLRSPLDRPVASGTGFFITEDGYLVTNDHVVRGSRRIRVRTRTETLDANLVKSSKALDLAILKAKGRFKPLPLDLDRTATLGESVFTIGFPNTDVQGTEPKYTDGKISSLSGVEDDPSQYQISVPVQPGNSGGPLVADNGSVIGIVQAKLNDLAVLVVSGSVPQNVNYAVKAKYLKDLLEPIPGLLESVRRPPTKARSESAIKTAEDATAIVLVY